MLDAGIVDFVFVVGMRLAAYWAEGKTDAIGEGGGGAAEEAARGEEVVEDGGAGEASQA